MRVVDGAGGLDADASSGRRRTDKRWVAREGEEDSTVPGHLDRDVKRFCARVGRDRDESAAPDLRSPTAVHRTLGWRAAEAEVRRRDRTRAADVGDGEGARRQSHLLLAERRAGELGGTEG